MNEIPQILINGSNGIFKIGSSGFSFIDLITISVSFFALIFSIKENKRKTREATIHALDTLQEKLYKISTPCIWDSREFMFRYNNEDANDIQSEFSIKDAITAQLRLIEHFSVGVNAGVYDIGTLDDMAGKRLIEIWDTLHPVIEERREKSGKYNPNTYGAFEAMVLSLKSPNGTNKKNFWCKQKIKWRKNKMKIKKLFLGLLCVIFLFSLSAVAEELAENEYIGATEETSQKVEAVSDNFVDEDLTVDKEALLDEADEEISETDAEADLEEETKEEASEIITSEVINEVSKEAIPMLMSSGEPTVLYSGTCGANLTWTLDDEGLLKISGSGDMTNYYNPTSGILETPWRSYRDSVKTIEIGENVTSISYYAFSGCTGVTNINISNSVQRIYEGAFKGCDSLEEITLPFIGKTRDTLTGYNSVFGYIFGYYMSTDKYSQPQPGTTLQYSWMSSHFGNEFYYYYIPTSIKKVRITDTKELGYSAFNGCNNINSIVFPNNMTEILGASFRGCNDLNHVYFNDSEEKWNTIVDYGDYDELKSSAKRYAIQYAFETNSEISVAPISTAESIFEPVFTYSNNLTLFGWYTDLGCLYNKVAFPYTSNTDVTLYAKWVCTVEYIGDYEATVYIDPDNAATLPNADYGYHYEFTSNGDVWDGQNITENVTVTVAKVRNTYNVTYEGDYAGSDSALYEADVTVPVCPEYGWHYEFTSNGDVWDGQNITENVTVTVAKVRNTYNVTYEGDYTGGDSALYEADVAVPVCPEYGWHYEFTVDGTAWTGKNITKDITVTVTRVKNTYTVTYEGDYTGTDTALYQEAITFPAPPENYIYRFYLDKNEWDGASLEKDITVKVKQLHDTAELSILNLEEMLVDNKSISGIYYGQKYIPEVSVTNNATYKLYTDIECKNEVAEYTLINGVNTVYIEITCESGRNDIYTLSINRAIPNGLGTLSLRQSVGGDLIFDVETKIVGTPTVKIKYGRDSESMIYETIATVGPQGRGIYVVGLPEGRTFCFQAVAVYDEIEILSGMILEQTGITYSDECDIVKVVSPPGAIIDNENLIVSGIRVSNKFDNIQMKINVSDKATWKMYSDINATEEIENAVVTLVAGGITTVYVRVQAEDGLHSKIYTMSIYRQSKTAPPIIETKNKTATISMEDEAEDVTIYYTTDGSTPIEGTWTKYTEPFSVDDGTVIKAIAKQDSKDEYSDVVMIVAKSYPTGDFDDDGEVKMNDVILMFKHLMSPEDYPYEGSCDINKDGKENMKDTVYLFKHMMDPETYPLN